ncbi:MAG: hypothetical protein FJ109_18435 [Deltaproteobacteria bacterium]|nr:hypothetical protein [Deltaproteobacteria bacterium]
MYRTTACLLPALALLALGCGGGAVGKGIPEADSGISDAPGAEGVRLPDLGLEFGGDTGGLDIPGGDTDGRVDFGEWGKPCASNADCESGYCIEVDENESVCTITCAEECPKDWLCKGVETPPDWTFICVPPSKGICKPCGEDDPCLYKGDLCLAIGFAGTFCGSDCSTGQKCPAHYKCTDVTDGAGNPLGSQCIPETGSCICTFELNGTSRDCSIQNEFGKCFGEEVCSGPAGWTGCTANTPSYEECDGKDQDCDGEADEGLEPSDCINQNDFGVCAGTKKCFGKDGWICDAAEPLPESCDLNDNDCDGETDEDFADFNEQCNGLDDNCNGLVDEGYPDPDNDKIADCIDQDDDGDGDPDETDCAPYDPTIHKGAVESCDGKDNDCDGMGDEDCSAVAWSLRQVGGTGSGAGAKGKWRASVVATPAGTGLSGPGGYKLRWGW